MSTRSYFEKLEKQFGTLTFGGLLRAWREGGAQPNRFRQEGRYLRAKFE